MGKITWGQQPNEVQYSPFLIFSIEWARIWSGILYMHDSEKIKHTYVYV